MRQAVKSLVMGCSPHCSRRPNDSLFRRHHLCQTLRSATSRAQTGQVFKFFKSDFDEEGEADLELAYALTVHKAQGSEFEVVFLVLPRSRFMFTRALLYTALTRRKKKVVVLHQGSAIDLQKLSSERFSALATRLTNLFGPPKPVKVGNSFLEERLIHITTREKPCARSPRSPSLICFTPGKWITTMSIRWK